MRNRELHYEPRDGLVEKCDVPAAVEFVCRVLVVCCAYGPVVCVCVCVRAPEESSLAS